jgi:hypothetical protein
MAKMAMLNYQMMPRILDFVGPFPNLGLLESVAILELSAMFREAHSTGDLDF